MIVMSRAERFGVRGRACDTDVAVAPVVVVVGGSWGGGCCWFTALSQRTSASVGPSSVNWPSGEVLHCLPVLQVCTRSRSAATYSVIIGSSYAPVVGPESLERVTGALWDGVG